MSVSEGCLDAGLWACLVDCLEWVGPWACLCWVVWIGLACGCVCGGLSGSGWTMGVSVSEGLSGSGWTVDMSVVDCLN